MTIDRDALCIDAFRTPRWIPKQRESDPHHAGSANALPNGDDRRLARNRHHDRSAPPPRNHPVEPTHDITLVSQSARPGKSLAKHWTTKGNWSIDAEGVVTLEPRPGETGWSRFDAYLWSTREYENFEIEFDYRVQPKGNSGFYFNVADRADPTKQGIEVQIYDSHPKGSDGKLTDHDSGGIIPRIPPTKNAAKPAGEWNRFHIVRVGDKLTVSLNGEVSTR